MKVCILVGSMKKNGNTAELIKPLKEHFDAIGTDCEYVWLSDYKLEPCKSCFVCQNVENVPGCSIKDEMDHIFEVMLNSDCIIFASPIYTWFCTVPMKLVLDRMFSMNKFYGSTKNNYSLMNGKKYAIVSTCGNEIETGADLFEKAIIRLAEHSGIDYIRMYAVQDKNGVSDFKTDEVVNLTQVFAKDIFEAFN